MSDNQQNLYVADNERYAKMFAESQAKLPEIHAQTDEGFKRILDDLKILEATGGEGVYETSPVEVASGACVPFPAVNQVLKAFEKHVVPAKSECLKEFPRLLAEARGAQRIAQLAQVIGGVLLPAAVGIGYQAKEQELGGQIMAKFLEIEETLQPNLDDIYIYIYLYLAIIAPRSLQH
ncbi:hypothetical protein M513_02594 [Trichuris suis]|uniref:Uncharacterized protein n=1 Tax=Trichuris suis TaxID=68888 RepID=A0A085MGZ4_9BILA|nr:hypothetical protein M513_02594 [Trichuris suis]